MLSIGNIYHGSSASFAFSATRALSANSESSSSNPASSSARMTSFVSCSFRRFQGRHSPDQNRRQFLRTRRHSPAASLTCCLDGFLLPQSEQVAESIKEEIQHNFLSARSFHISGCRHLFSLYHADNAFHCFPAVKSSERCSKGTVPRITNRVNTPATDRPTDRGSVRPCHGSLFNKLLRKAYPTSLECRLRNRSEKTLYYIVRGRTI